MRHHTRLLLTCILGIGTAACGAEIGADVLAQDDYTAAIPSEQMLALTTEANASAEAQAGADANGVAAMGRDVMQGIDQLRADTHASLRALVASTTPTEITRGDATCKVWAQTGDGVNWQLVSCRVDARADRYAFVLRGRAESSTSESDFLPVFAGEGRRLPDFAGERRGAGRVGYNFDHLSVLTGVEAGGQLGLGYRAAGRVRQLVLGLRDVHGPDDEESTTALFRYDHRVGVGGRFAFVTGADFIARDTLNELVSGEDGVAELARVAMAWNEGGEARTLVTACGGTLGQGVCVRIAQCWSADGATTYGEVALNEPTWSEAACPAVDFGDAAADDQVPASEDEAGAPVVDEPAPSADE